MKRILKRMIGLLAVLLVSVWGASTPKAMIIFDASGSMWGQIDGVNKIVIARDALKSVVQKWNPKVELGLTVYGHRVKGDCNDIQTILPIAKVNKKQMIDTVFAIQPKGMTPIAKSLRQVANSLRQYEEQTTIILISDGRESCEEDPCVTAKQLKAEGINFVAHVVGFNVDASTDKQLACVAKATGGEYFSAKNAVALNKAIKVIAKKVAKPKPKPIVLKNTTLELIARYQMSPAGLNVSGMQWEVTQGGKALYSGSKESPKIPAKVGKVHIKATYNRTSEVQKVEGDITLRAKKNNPVTIQLKSGKVTIDTAEEQGGPKVKSSVRIYPVLNGQPNMSDEIAWCVPTRSKACVRVLPIGEYMLTATYNSMKTQKSFGVRNKEKQKIHLYFKQTGKVKVSASEKEGGKWISASCRIYNEDKSDSWGIYPRKKESSSSVVQLPVGKYTLNCSYNAFKRKDIPVEVKAGETTKMHVVFKAFMLGAKCLNANEKVSYEVYASSGELVYDKRTVCSRVLKLILDDGAYSVEATTVAGKGEVSFETGAGKPKRLILDLTNLKHEAEMQADAPVKSQTITPTIPKPVQQKIQDLNQAAEAITKTVNNHKDDLKKMGDLLNALGGLMEGKQKPTIHTQSTPKDTTELNISDDDLQLFSK